MHEENWIPVLCTTSVPTQSWLVLMLATAFSLWEAVQSLQHRGTSLHQKSGSKRCLLRELGCKCSPGEPKHCTSTTLWWQRVATRTPALWKSIQGGLPPPSTLLHSRTAFCKLSHRNEAQTCSPSPSLLPACSLPSPRGSHVASHFPAQLRWLEQRAESDPKLQISALGSCTGNKRSEISEVHSWNPHPDHVFVRYHVRF